MGCNKFMMLFKNACDLQKIAREGNARRVTIHGLCSTLASILFEHFHSDYSIAICMGHQDLNSVKAYQHLRGATAFQQKRDLVCYCGTGKEQGQVSGGSNNDLSFFESTTKCSKNDTERPAVVSSAIAQSGSCSFSHIGELYGSNITTDIYNSENQTNTES